MNTGLLLPIESLLMTYVTWDLRHAGPLLAIDNDSDHIECGYPDRLVPSMPLLDKTRDIIHLLRWRLSWDRRDIDYHPAEPLTDKFRTAREAAELIDDGATVLSCGLGGNARCSIFFWAVRERFEAIGRPCSLTWISVGGQGGRGKIPGTVEEVALPGLVSRYISGHLETAKSMLSLADRGLVSLHTMPQGEMTHAIEAQCDGRESVRSRTGIGTEFDPRVGRGSPVSGAGEGNLISVAGNELEFRLPGINVALMTAPYADATGNIYFKNAAVLTENIEAARAARANAGLVMVAVGDIIEEDRARVSIPAGDIDVIVVNPRNEQAAGIPQRRYWRMFTPGGDGDDAAAGKRVRFINNVLRITPFRGPADHAMARLGASLFTRELSPGVTANLGVGHGEEVTRVLCEQGMGSDITFTTETGVYGGRPASGVFFGAAINPLRLESSAWMFHHYRDHLDAALLGFLQVDSAGNVNASNRGPRFYDYIGPGGLPSITAAARTVFFIGGWMTGARWRINRDSLLLQRAGRPKFVDRVREITFNGQVALEEGKRVFYVTHVGAFELTRKGLMLVEVMPGIDIEKDIIGRSEARIILPEAGEVPVAAISVLTGMGFSLEWTKTKEADHHARR
jgi:propionate CoA-transferase